MGLWAPASLFRPHLKAPGNRQRDPSGGGYTKLKFVIKNILYHTVYLTFPGVKMEVQYKSKLNSQPYVLLVLVNIKTVDYVRQNN